MSGTRIRVEANLECPGPEGLRLITDIYRPDCDDRVPAVLLRTPYGRGQHADEGLGWVANGLAFVVQDTRGRGDSDGNFEPYAHEAADGVAALEWVRDQPWCSGDVILLGGSYAAFCAWATAAAHPLGARGVISMVPAMGTHRTGFTESGILNLGDHVWWWSSFAEGRGERKRLVDLMLTHEPSVLMHLPVVELDTRLWVRLRHWGDVVRNGPRHVPEWALTNDMLARVKVPVLHIGGWHDPFIRETLEHAAVVGSANSPRPRQDLIVGPWSHTMEFNSTVVGARDYGAAAMLPLGQLMVEWIRDILAGRGRSRTRLFLAGANVWREDLSPFERGGSLRLYATYEGCLSMSLPHEAGEATFVDDPQRPFPSCSMPIDIAETLDHPGSLKFLTDTLKRPLVWAGTPLVFLKGTSSTATCDWMARLVEVQPDGRSVYIAHGIVDRPAGAEQPHDVCIPLTPCAVEIPPGNRLCLQIAGSYFPEHARNLHTGDRYFSTSARPAIQRVLLDGSTFVVLPEVPA